MRFAFPICLRADRRKICTPEFGIDSIETGIVGISHLFARGAFDTAEELMGAITPNSIREVRAEIRILPQANLTMG